MSLNVSTCVVYIFLGRRSKLSFRTLHLYEQIQFGIAVPAAAKALNERDRPATIPQAKPLSPGEVFGCTAPAGLAPAPSSHDSAATKHVMLFIADGRFHLEAAMIANPNLRVLRYDPYSKKLMDEHYENDKMKAIRQSAIHCAMDPSVKVVGIILGTIGRKGKEMSSHFQILNPSLFL